MRYWVIVPGWWELKGMPYLLIWKAAEIKSGTESYVTNAKSYPAKRIMGIRYKITIKDWLINFL